MPDNPGDSTAALVRSGLTFRPATNADGEAAAALVFAVLNEHGLAPDPGGTDADLLNLETYYFANGGRFDLLIDLAAQIAGTVGLARINQQTCELRKMYLRRDYRGKGLGRFLLDHALASARVMGCRRVILETATVLKEAIALYQRAGFRPYAAEHMACRCDLAMELAWT